MPASAFHSAAEHTDLLSQHDQLKAGAGVALESDGDQVKKVTGPQHMIERSIAVVYAVSPFGFSYPNRIIAPRTVPTVWRTTNYGPPRK